MNIDLERRKIVMSRSVKLGHCICNPRKPCPCDTFIEHNICSCAGEKMPVKSGVTALTKFVRKAGCASKIGQADLMRILKKLPPVTDPNVLVGVAAGDDAGVYRIDDHLSIVQTVDVFTPCVDDAFLFGRIAAANSVSDIYAMGGKPLTALSIIGFPIDELDGAVMVAILRGGMEKLQEAGCSLIGGHSINDEEIKCGFAVTGLIDEDKTVERGMVSPDDVLILTKPLGTGIVCFGAQIDRISAECLKETGASMAELNKDAAELMVKYGANACTDVTGYGLMGHLVEMVRNVDVSAEIDMSALPVFAVVEDCLRNDILPGAIERNMEYSMAWVDVGPKDGLENLPILYDPQTSGGLLISMPEEMSGKFIDEMMERGHNSTSIIGRIVRRDKSRPGSRVFITNTQLRNFIGSTEGLIMSEVKKNETAVPPVETSPDGSDSSCCDSPPETGSDNHAETLELFGNFMRKSNEGGLIDSRSKKLIAVALSVAQRCKPCLTSHIKSALSMGISKAEIGEAANIAIAFSGSPAMVLYKEVLKEIDG